MSGSGNESRLREIYGNPDSPNLYPIEKSLILDYMTKNDIEVRGIIYELINKSEFVDRIHPPLLNEEYLVFSLSYLADCVRLDHDNQDVLSTYEATWEIARLFLHYWKVEPTGPSTAEIKMWLSRLYIQLGDKGRRAIINGTLEHLFQATSIRDWFSDWLHEPSLQRAYHLASDPTAPFDQP